MNLHPICTRVVFLAMIPFAIHAAPPPDVFVPGTTESLAWLAATQSENLALRPGVQATSPNKPVFGPNVAAAAIDGNPKTEWAAADAGGAVLQLQFPTPVRINGVSLARDISTERPEDSGAAAVFVIETSTDGQSWETVAATGKAAVRVTQWAALFAEREVRFLRMRITAGSGRVGEIGVFHADLNQVGQWGWQVPEAAYRIPLDRQETTGGECGINLALARGNAEGVILPRSLHVVAGRTVCPTVFVCADPKFPEIGRLAWHEERPTRGGHWLYFAVGKAEDALPPATAGEWSQAGFQWHGKTVAGATPGQPLWIDGTGGGWVIPADREGLRLAVSTTWDGFLRNKPLTVTAQIANSGEAPFDGQLQLGLARPGQRTIELDRPTLRVPAGATEKRVSSLDISKVSSGDYLLVAQLVRRGQVLAESQRPVYVGPVPHPGMTFGIYAIPYWNGEVGQAKGIADAAEIGFTEITGQYWGEGYSFQADQGLRRGLLWNPTIEPIYNQNALADKDPSAAVIGPDGKRVSCYPAVCYTHPEVVKRTEAEAEQWLRDIVSVPGFGGYVQADDDVHLADSGCYNASCRDLFKQATGRDVPQADPKTPNHPQVVPPPGLIADDQPWLQWFLFRCSHIRGNVPKIYMRAKNRVDPQIKMGAVRGHMQFPFYTPATGEYPPLFDALYDAPGSYAYLYWVRQTEDYIAHGALAAMGNRGKGRWIAIDFAYSWCPWVLEKGGDGRWQLNLNQSLEGGTGGNLYPPGALNKEIWCVLAGGFNRIHMFELPERGARNGLDGTEDERVLRTWGARVRAYGKLLAALQEPPRPVAILTSISTSAFTDGLTHSGITASVFKDCLREHVPVDMIAEEEILAGDLATRKVLLCPDLQYLRRSVATAIEQWAANGGIVIAESGAAVQPAGSHAVKRSEMAAAAGRVIHRQLECDNPLVIAREFELDGVRYYYLVNVYTDRWSAGLANDPWVAGDNSIFTELYTPRAQRARLRIPNGSGTAWDVFGNRAYTADADGSLEVTVGGDDGLLLALYPREPDKLAVKSPAKAKAGDEVKVAVNLSAADGSHMRGGVPVHLAVIDPKGAESEYSQNALATGGVAEASFRTAVNDRPGKWRVRAESLVGTAAGETTVRVVP